FEARNIGLAVQRRMAREFAGDPKKIRESAVQSVTRALDLDAGFGNEDQKCALQNLSLVLAMIPKIAAWNQSDKELAARIIRAKSNADEALYLKLMQRHVPLREALIRFGS
ncbi:MAG: hypothetical protein ACXW18_06505, partial [Pyrinomonadaceae bacterium]